MPLLTDELKSRLPPIWSQEAEGDPMVYAKLYLPGTSMAWYLIEGEAWGSDFMLFGFVVGADCKFENFLLSELEGIKTPDGSGVERDTSFAEGRLTDVVPAPEI